MVGDHMLGKRTSGWLSSAPFLDSFCIYAGYPFALRARQGLACNTLASMRSKCTTIHPTSPSRALLTCIYSARSPIPFFGPIAAAMDRRVVLLPAACNIRSVGGCMCIYISLSLLYICGVVPTTYFRRQKYIRRPNDEIPQSGCPLPAGLLHMVPHARLTIALWSGGGRGG